MRKYNFSTKCRTYFTIETSPIQISFKNSSLSGAKHHWVDHQICSYSWILCCRNYRHCLFLYPSMQQNFEALRDNVYIYIHQDSMFSFLFTLPLLSTFFLLNYKKKSHVHLIFSMYRTASKNVQFLDFVYDISQSVNHAVI